MDAAADYLGSGPGHPRAIRGGRLSVEGGGIAFWSPEGGWTGPWIAGPALRRVVPGAAAPADRRSPVGYRGLEFEGLVEARLIRFGFRLSAWDAPALLSDLARERRRAALPAIRPPMELAMGDDRAAWGGCAAPSPRERGALPLGSVPHSWLQATAGPGPRARTRHVDGMSMLLELAARGLIDAEQGSGLTVARGQTGNPALDGALERLRDDAHPADAEPAASWLGAYAGELSVNGMGADALRARVWDAIASGGPLDLRIALLVWLVKQDEMLGQAALAAIAGDGDRRPSASRALRVDRRALGPPRRG